MCLDCAGIAPDVKQLFSSVVLTLHGVVSAARFISSCKFSACESKCISLLCSYCKFKVKWITSSHVKQGVYLTARSHTGASQECYYTAKKKDTRLSFCWLTVITLLLLYMFEAVHGAYRWGCHLSSHVKTSEGREIIPMIEVTGVYMFFNVSGAKGGYDIKPEIILTEGRLTWVQLWKPNRYIFRDVEADPLRWCFSVTTLGCF